MGKQIIISSIISATISLVIVNYEEILYWIGKLIKSCKESKWEASRDGKREDD